MNTTQIDFEITDVRGRIHVLRAVNVDGGDWHLKASVDGRTFTHRCKDWQAVERTLRQLRAQAQQRRPAVAQSTSAPARALVAGLLLVISIVASAAGQAQERPATPDGIARFVQAAEDYAVMHRRLERDLPPVEVTPNPETIGGAIGAMAAAIRAERHGAKPGDLFNPDAQAAIRARIAQALRSHGQTASDVLAAERSENGETGAVELPVNGTFPWAVSTAMFRSVLEALPPLPSELMYRMVGRDLVLIDVHASLIVDILPAALGGHSCGHGGTHGHAPHECCHQPGEGSAGRASGCPGCRR